MSLAVPLRLQFFSFGMFSATVIVSPGVRFDQFNTPTAFGFLLPVGVEVGVKLTQQLTVQGGFDVPTYINVNEGAYAGIPVLFGAGGEYMIDPHITVGVNTRFGPSIATDREYHWPHNTDLGVLAQAYAAYRF